MERTSDCYRSLDDKPFESIYLYVDAVIDQPIDKVWPHALNIGSWMNKHDLETVAGEPGKVGHFQKVLPRGLGSDVPLPHYHLYGIAHIVPPKLIVLEVLPEKGGSYGKTRPKMTFDTISLTDLGGRTQIAYLLIEANLGKGPEDFYGRRKAEIESVRTTIESFFGNLQRLAANS